MSQNLRQVILIRSYLINEKSENQIWLAKLFQFEEKERKINISTCLITDNLDKITKKLKLL